MKHLFNQTMTLQRKIYIDDGQGGTYLDWQNIGTIRGRLRPASASERTVAAQEQAVISHVFYCSADEDIRRGDRLINGGLTVEIIAVKEPSYMGHHLECEGLVVQNG